MTSPYTPSQAEPADLPGFRHTFRPGQLTLGVFLPIESFRGDTPAMAGQVELVQRAEEGGFAAAFLRDVPLRDPDFGDVGQLYDPFVYLGLLAGQTSRIALGTGAVVLPVRHPLHVAKAAASVDRLSGGRLLLGVATGDRAVEAPAFGLNQSERAEIFREHLAVIDRVFSTSFRGARWSTGRLWDADLVPKPLARRTPILITGSCQQTMAWNAEHGDGWMTYHRPLPTQRTTVAMWRAAVGEGAFKPVGESMSLDLHEDPDAPPANITFGFRVGRNGLIRILREMEAIGLNHVAFGLKAGSRPAPEVLEELIRYVVPHFPAHAAGQGAGAGLP